MALQLTAGTRVGARYVLEREIGAGGFGFVWAARDARSGARVAIKFLRHAADSLEHRRFAREARVLDRIDHPNCLRIFASGTTEDGAHYFVTELVAGQTLQQWIEADPKRAAGAARAVAIQICAALCAAHELRVTHRDLKPANVMVDDSDHLTVKVLDFGLAKLMGVEQTDVTKTGDVLGTPGYMSPEQLRGRRDVGPSTDMYALGLILYAMLAGTPPFVGDSPLAICMAHLAEPAPGLGPSVPSDLRDLVARLLAKDPRARPTARETLRLLSGERLEAQQVAPRLPPRRRTALKVLAGGFIAVLGVFVALGPWKESPPPVRRPLARIPSPPDNPKSVAPVEAREPDRADGCGQPRGAGVETRQVLGPGGALELHEWQVYVPTNYDPSRAHSVVLTLAQHGTSARQFLARTRLIEQADEHGFLVVAPEPVDGRWEGERDALKFVVEQVQERYCVDARRVFAVGFIAGGHAAARLTCEPWIAGAAAASARPEEAVLSCSTPRPFLLLSPMKTEHATPAGGPNCMGNPKISLADHERIWRERNGCTGERTVAREHLGSTCFRWACDQAFESCHLDGGHNWPGAPARFLGQVSPDCGDGPATDFPIGEVVWAFFDALPPRDAELPAPR